MTSNRVTSTCRTFTKTSASSARPRSPTDVAQTIHEPRSSDRRSAAHPYVARRLQTGSMRPPRSFGCLHCLRLGTTDYRGHTRSAHELSGLALALLFLCGCFLEESFTGDTGDPPFQPRAAIDAAELEAALGFCVEE